MTDKLYFTSDALHADTEVLSCTAEEDGRFRVILAATLFHPQGGGQPSDQGTIETVKMLQAIQDGTTVTHFTDAPLDIGPVKIQVDAQLRQQYTRYHSAAHLIANAGEKYGWYGYKGNHRPGEGRVVFRAPGETLAITAELLSADVSELIAQSLPLRTYDEQGKRMVTWGYLPAYACGGTHVKHTADIGQTHISSVKIKKGELSVQYTVKD